MTHIYYECALRCTPLFANRTNNPNSFVINPLALALFFLCVRNIKWGKFSAEEVCFSILLGLE